MKKKVGKHLLCTAQKEKPCFFHTPKPGSCQHMCTLKTIQSSLTLQKWLAIFHYLFLRIHEHLSSKEQNHAAFLYFKRLCKSLLSSVVSLNTQILEIHGFLQAGMNSLYTHPEPVGSHPATVTHIDETNPSPYFIYTYTACLRTHTQYGDTNKGAKYVIPLCLLQKFPRGTDRTSTVS